MVLFLIKYPDAAKKIVCKVYQVASQADKKGNRRKGRCVDKRFHSINIKVCVCARAYVILSNLK